MTNLIKKTLTGVSLLGVIAVLAGCSGICQMSNARHHKRGPVKEKVVYYQTYENADVNRVTAKMFTRSSQGGESKMGHIKFAETDSGLKMDIDLKDLRPGVVYNIKVQQCNVCSGNSNACCGYSTMNMDLPTLRIANAGRLEQTYMLHGITAAQLRNGKILLERDGGYKAAWGTLDQ